MLLRNMDVSLHQKYRECKTGVELWKLLLSNYASKQSNTQASVLTSVVEYHPPVEMDDAVLEHEKNVRKMVNAWGATMSTELVVQILFTQNAEYQTKSAC